MVYFWVREGGSQEDAQKIAEGCKTYLANIPEVLRLEVGFPAGTLREVVDNSYGVALLVELADAEAHEIYQEHPEHLKFIEACRAHWSQVKVYDTHVF